MTSPSKIIKYSRKSIMLWICYQKRHHEQYHSYFYLSFFNIYFTQKLFHCIRFRLITILFIYVVSRQIHLLPKNYTYGFINPRSQYVCILTKLIPKCILLLWNIIIEYCIINCNNKSLIIFVTVIYTIYIWFDNN